MFDVAIIGTGPAGLSAAITLKLHEKSILWFGSPQFSAKVEKSEKIANYPGAGLISGEELNRRFQQHASEMALEPIDRMVTTIVPIQDHFSLLADNEIYEAKTLLMATGVVTAKGIPGETEFLGRGVSYCATCDAMLYRNRPVIVLGTDQESVEEANFLATVCSKVSYACEKKHDLSALDEKIARLSGKPLSIEKEGKTVRVTLEGGEKAEADCVFVLRPTVAPSTLLPGLETEGSAIRHDEKMHTSIPRVCVAGDAAGAPLQVAKAVGDGCVAAYSLSEDLKKA